MRFCVYYDQTSQEILDFLPQDMDASTKSSIFSHWKQDISRKILLLLSSEESMIAPQIKEKIGHSMSTLHEIIKKMEDDGLISTKMVYKGKKQKVITPNVLCITKNPNHKVLFQRFFQGLWVDSKKTDAIVKVLKDEPEKFFSAEDISLKLHIPVDEVEIHLSNWDSQATKFFSRFMKAKPFEKKILYRSK